MKHEFFLDHSKALELICEALESDLDAPVCRELATHLQACPSCRIYFDSVKKTVRLYQNLITEPSVPADVQEWLFSVLQLRK